jgi:hypothetical protein
MKWFFAAALLTSFFLVAGCGEGVAHSFRERENRWNRIFEYDERMLVDDFDAALLMDDTSRLSYWRIRSIR